MQWAGRKYGKNYQACLEQVTKDAILDTLIARFLAMYRNTRHTTASRTPAELLLNCVPRIRLSLVHPCTSQRLEQAAEMQVGDKQPRSFAVNDNVMVRDIHPNATDYTCTTVITTQNSLHVLPLLPLLYNYLRKPLEPCVDFLCLLVFLYPNI